MFCFCLEGIGRPTVELGRLSAGLWQACQSGVGRPAADLCVPYDRPTIKKAQADGGAFLIPSACGGLEW